MNTILLLIGLQVNAEANTNADSAVKLFTDMPMFSRMYINGTDMKIELKRSLWGYHWRPVDSDDTVVYKRQSSGAFETRVISNNRWGKIENVAGFETWFTEMDIVNGQYGDRSKCGYTGSSYVLSTDTESVFRSDETCLWSGEERWTQLVTPSELITPTQVYIVENVD